MRFFHDCTTIEEVKATYKKLAMENHPDRGGDTATMQAINSEYAYACAHITKDQKMTAEEADQEIRLSEEYRLVIEAIICIPGIIIKIVGLWIWVTGNTYPVRAELKAAGLRFAPKKKEWYYRAEEYKTRGSNLTMEEIERKYGSQTVHPRGGSKTLHT